MLNFKFHVNSSKSAELFFSVLVRFSHFSYRLQLDQLAEWNVEFQFQVFMVKKELKFYTCANSTLFFSFLRASNVFSCSSSSSPHNRATNFSHVRTDATLQLGDTQDLSNSVDSSSLSN